MALQDYITEKTEEKVAIPFASPAMAEQSANALTMADIQMATAEKMAQNRARAEELKKKIANLNAQNDELRARRDKIKANSLSDMDEDKVVAMAKAKGIKDSDIEAWLHGRTARTNREISLGQKASLDAQERAMAETNKQNAAQAIFDAEAELAQAEKAVPDEQLRAQDAIVKAKRNKLETLKGNFKKSYGESWEDFSGKKDITPKKTEDQVQNGVDEIKVDLTEEESATLDEPTAAKFNESTTTNKEKREIKAKAQQKIREKEEADKRREKQLKSVKDDLATIGAKSGTDADKIINGFEKSADRNDPVKRAAISRLKNFVGKDKDFKKWKDLDKLFKTK